MFSRLLLGGVLLSTTFMLLTGCTKHGDTDKIFGPDIEISQYVRYDMEKVQASLDAGDNVMIFVGATRCPPCMSLHKNIVVNADKIPESLVIYAADYDAHKELNTQYNITAKHTSIYLDATGAALINQKAKDYRLDHILETAAELYK